MSEAIISVKSVSIQFGGPLILDQVSFEIAATDRVALIGRNGEGKSTLMKLLMNQYQPDSGEVFIRSGCRVTCLTQEIDSTIGGSILDVVIDGLGAELEPIKHYQSTLDAMENDTSSELFETLHHWEKELTNRNLWDAQRQAEKILSQLKLPIRKEFGTLSTGLKRRVLLARALIREPDLLLLDEPTNHLDVAAIEWFEHFFSKFKGALLFVTHDRAFLQKIANRTLELDRGKLTSWNCGYQKFLERKEAWLQSEEEYHRQFDKKMNREEAWLRRGIKARRARNEGRVRNLMQLRQKRAERRERGGKVSLQTQEADLSGQKVFFAQSLNFSYQGTPIIKGFDCQINRGDKVAIIGNNGCGKSTLLKLLLGELQPTQGTLKRGTNLKVAYFDQQRSALDESLQVWQAVADANDQVTINGKSKHVISYLEDFLFSPERARTPVKILSGGEKNRLLLARLFAKPANVLVLDEPTNDLDIETLEILEALLVSYLGTLLLVSHDRIFIDHIATSSLVFTTDGKIKEFIGGFYDWQEKQAPKGKAPNFAEKGKEKKKPPQKRKRTLSYKEKIEVESLPEQIDLLEQEQAVIMQALSDPKFFKNPPDTIQAQQNRLQEIEKLLKEKYDRWQALEEVLEN